ncbi:hypothetical protein N0V86_000129 [Didymella sp. IMI 355093]|nr:hypothetical protein N0V86_000129 [Didymella sp. IMI 355093]
MHQQPFPPRTAHRWTLADDARLHHLRFIELGTWPEVAVALGRTTQAVPGHYYQLKIAEGASFEEWDPSMDEYIIECRGQGESSKEIASEMGVPAEAVQGRWYELQQQKRVPESVLAVWRKKGEVRWTEKDDGMIVRAWIDGKSESDIAHSLQFEGKYQCDIKQRYKHLFREKGPVYRRLMGMEENKLLPHALDKALGKKKYAWM